MSQDPPPNVPISDPPPTHPQEVKAVAADLGEFVASHAPSYDSASYILDSVDPTNPIDSLDVFAREVTKTPIEPGRRYKLLLIIEQDGP